MRDGWLRRALKRVALWRYNLDMGITRTWLRWRGEPQYELRGDCVVCGECCEAPTVVVWRPLLYLRSTRALILAWHRYVNGFEKVGMDRRHGMIVFRCTHYDPRSKLCDSYDSRPGMCRDYPRNLLYEAQPTFLPGCSHCAVHKRAGEIRAELDLLDLPPEKREAVARSFYVWEPEKHRETHRDDSDQPAGT